MRCISLLLRAMPMAVAAILISGCAGSGYLNDLNRYARTAKGPDIASSDATLQAIGDRKETETIPAVSTVETDADNVVNVETGAIKDALVVPAGNAISAFSETLTTRNIERSESQTSYGTERPVFHASTSAEARMASQSKAKVRKAQRQPPEIEWFNNSRKDWFFLIMAGLGLVVGLFGQGFGWVVFLIFGGLFLYRKIVRRK